MLTLDELIGRAPVRRELLDWPPGDNGTDTVLGGTHFNLTTLQEWNYTLYSNGTVSNGSKCWLTYEPYQPAELFANGSFVNATKCYVAIDPIGLRGYTGIGVAVAYGMCLVGVLTCLAKHGRIYVRQRDNRFYPIGRRWQWYWGCWVCGAALIGLFLNVDVDRYHVLELPMIITTFFWYLLSWGTVALVWEAVRHWGSWQMRQYVDPDPFVLRDDDRRAKVEFFSPLWFYFWWWLNFFLVVPRSWSWVPKQRDADQQRLIAEPRSQDGRFRASGFVLFVCWLTTVFSLYHSIQHYRPRHRGFLNRSLGLVSSIPLRLLLLIVLCLATIAYQELIAWDFDVSVAKFNGSVPVIYGWGYGPPLLILVIQIMYGWASPNEDRELLRQRRERGDTIDRGLGIVNKPAWWTRVRGDHLLSYKDKLQRQVQEVGGRRGVGRRDLGEMEAVIHNDGLEHADNDDGFELAQMSSSSRTKTKKNSDGDYNPRVDRAGANRRPTNLWTDDPSGASFHPPKPVDEGLFSRVSYLTESGPARPASEVKEPGASFNPPSEADRELARKLDYLTGDGPAESSASTRPGHRDERRESSRSASTLNSVQGSPQQIRSMLDA